MLNKYWAFTSRAFVQAVYLYGESLFEYAINKNIKIYVVEEALLRDKFAQVPISESERPILKYWHYLNSPPPFGETNEFLILNKLDNLHPDEVDIFVYNLYEFAWMNRTYSNDDIYIAEDIGKMWEKEGWRITDAD